MKNKFLNFNKYVSKYIYDSKLIYPLIFVISLYIPSIFLLSKCNIINENLFINFMVCILLVINLDLILLNIIKQNYKIEHVFVSLILPIGLSMMLMILPNHIPDEAAHSYRAYVISEGHLLTKKNEDNTPKMEVPKQLLKSLEQINTYKDLSKSLKEQANYNDIVAIGLDGAGASTYFFGGYLFPALAMKIGKIFNINIIITYYL